MPSLSESERLALLHLARQAVTEAVSRGQILAAIPSDGFFAQPRGVFVSLHMGKRLRGCIGVIEAQGQLRESIIHCAHSAAFHDPRFPPLRAEELPGLQIEISILSELFPIALQQIQIGKHGLLVATENHRGLLLPQVATEHQLSREEFLEETCHKAGLPRDAWRAPHTKIYAFTCEIFREDASVSC